MVDFRPFRGIRYDTAVAGPMSDLVCPPYDVISPAMERELLERSEHNMVRLELAEIEGPAPVGRYADAAGAFSRMLASDVLRRDEAPAYYVLRQRFAFGGRQWQRLGVLGALRLAELGTDVLPHEVTRPGPKEDRLELMRAAEANFSPLMMLYRDPSGRISDEVATVTEHEQPSASFDFDGDDLTLWTVDRASSTAAVQSALAGERAYVADGHHRYETAIVYRDERGGSAGEGSAWAYVLTCMIAFDDPGLLVLPYYRVVHGLDSSRLGELQNLLATLFDRTPASASPIDAAGLDRVVSAAAATQPVLGLVERGAAPSLLSPRASVVPELEHGAGPEALSQTVEAVVLQEKVLRPLLGDAFVDHVAYVHDGREALEMVERGDGQAAFFIKGVPPPVFEAIVGAGIRLPAKSTYFHPKLPSGLVINPLSGDL